MKISESLTGATTLPGAYEDAKKIPGLIKNEPFHFQTSSFVDVSPDDFYKQVKKSLETIDRLGTLLIYFSGHGFPLGNDLILFSPSKSRIEQVKARSQKVIRDQDFVSFVKIIQLIQASSTKPSRVLFFLDDCYSGRAIEVIKNESYAPPEELAKASELKGVSYNSSTEAIEHGKKIMSGKNLGFELFIFTAVDSKTGAKDSSTGGYFSKALMRAIPILKKQNKPTIKDFADLVSDISESTASENRRPTYAAFPENSIMNEPLFN